MRSLIWSNTFVRAFKRVLKKQREVREDIEILYGSWFRTLLRRSLKRTNSKGNYPAPGHAVQVMICVLFLIL